MKKALLVLAIVFASASASFAQRLTISFDVIAGNRAPNPNEMNVMRMEEARHPDITKSMHDVGDAMTRMRQIPDDFGGHKAQAYADLKQAWISLRKCLYYRIYQDTH